MSGEQRAPQAEPADEGDYGMVPAALAAIATVVLPLILIGLVFAAAVADGWFVGVR